MQSFIITKWIEPYRLLETIKKYYDCKDFTFDGLNKQNQKEKFFSEIKKSSNNVGLYMKNVNKFYLFTRLDKFDIVTELINIFGFTSEDYFFDKDIQKPFSLVDIAKAEAGILFE